jgi:hypothetical protein
MRKETGEVSGLLVVNIALIVLVLGLGSVMIWALTNYSDQKNNVDQKIATAVEVAKDEQADADEKDFIEREKEPFKDFVGPVDLGAVTFKYPKTWNLYVPQGRGNEFNAYFHPDRVHGIDGDMPYAMRVSIRNESYQEVLDDYTDLIEDGFVKSKRVTVNEFEGNRLDGTFSDTIEGSVVVFKIRDKTLLVYTELANFRKDFNNIILKTLNFNP